MNKDEMLESILHSLERIEARQNKPWVDLTHDEAMTIVGRNDSGDIGAYTRKLFKQIEDKLREKNT